jgi:hypothetical protein
MGRNRFPTQKTVRCELSDGDWIEIKEDLNNGDTKQLEQSGVQPPRNDGTGRIVIPVDWAQYELERALIFLTDWSFRDAADKPVKITMDALKALEPETFVEVHKAISDHVVARAEAKKAERAAKQQSSTSTSENT